MKAEKVQQIIADYNALEDHTLRVIDKLGILDSKMYGTARGINNISYDEKEVGVECDNSYCGDNDTHYFYFPISFLSMPDEELEQAVLVEKQKREEEERLKKQQIEKELRAKQEQQERLQYERLKKKFETK
jgi:hypothetical protein